MKEEYKIPYSSNTRKNYIKRKVIPEALRQKYDITAKMLHYEHTTPYASFRQ